MTLSNKFDDQFVSADEPSSNWEALYCSHTWTGAATPNEAVINYCYTCKEKIRNYRIKSSNQQFLPNNHSTPNQKLVKEDNELPKNLFQDNRTDDINRPRDNSFSRHDMASNVDGNQCIPSISRRVDYSFRQKYISYEMGNSEVTERRLRKSLKGIGCIVNLALTESPVKKWTQIQACSITIMIVAIVVISFILVNFTSTSFTSFTNGTNVNSTILVPTSPVKINVTWLNTIPTETVDRTTEININDNTTTEKPLPLTENKTLLSNIILKIRKNVRTFPKNQNSQKPKDIINRDLSPQFCSCQTNEVCMLDENTGTSICRKAVDNEDPTGCGGLCALDTEACQLVDRQRGVRVCRMLTLVTCSSDQWRCRNGLCVPAGARCDGVVQCYDRSDEMHCECDLTKQFRCGHSISCFSNTKLCNGIIDCWDGRDELNCTAECAEHQFTCTDGQCILASRFCDGLADCGDGSDEPQGCGVCASHELRCTNQRCVPRAAHCDGLDHCGDGSDELHCS